MGSQRDECPTAVKVRGKRRAATSEKWPTGKHRKPELQTRPARILVSASQSSSLRPRKRKQKTLADESPLERLPAEVLQHIFEYSANIELPTVSRKVALRLSKSNHLQHQLTSRLLRPVLGHVPASSKELSCATRLLNSRFLTWEFFVEWLRGQTSSLGLSSPDGLWNAAQVKRAWLALQPSPALLPPRKLLSSPFNQEKVQLLAVLSSNIRDIVGMDAAYGELGHAGLVEAIRHNHREAISILLSIGLGVSTESLRVAVTEAGCNEGVVCTLVEHAGNDGDGMVGSLTDLLDPVLWAWAEDAQRNGNERGRWLVDFLRDAQQQKKRTNSGAHGIQEQDGR